MIETLITVITIQMVLLTFGVFTGIKINQVIKAKELEETEDA